MPYTDENMFTDDPVNAKLRYWCRIGYEMPGYEYANGAPYLMKLLGYNPATAELHFGDYLQKHHSGLTKALIGPHGWAVMKTLIARQQEKENEST